MGAEMKKVVSGGPMRAMACPEADAGLLDTVPAREKGTSLILIQARGKGLVA